MFDFIRSHQRLMQFVLLVLIVPSFALIGVSGYNSYKSGDHDLVRVGGAAITLQDFERARANQLQQMQQSVQGGFDPAVLDNPQVRSALLDSLIDYRVVLDIASSERFSASDMALRKAIAAIPQFQVDGRFSAERYNEVLASAGITTRDFEEGQRAELALDRVLGPVRGTASVPQPVVDHLERVLTEQRTVRSRVFAADDYRDTVTVTDGDIQTWYEAHRQEFEVPEYVAIQYLLLDEEAAMANLPAVTDADLQAYYEQNKARFSKPGRIKLSHIQISVAAGATEEDRQAALEQARTVRALLDGAPDEFASIAREHSQDAGTARTGGDLGWVAKGGRLASLDATLFALDKGEISDVLEGPGGYHIFRVNEVQPEEVQPLAEISDQIRDEIRRQMGAERFADMATRLTSLVYDHPDSLEAVGQALSMTIKVADGIGRDGLIDAVDVGDHAAALSADATVLDDVRVRRSVFSPQVYRERHNSGVIEISPDTMLAVRVQDVTPAHIPELDRVSDRIRARVTGERAHAAAVAAGQEFLAALSADNELSDPADSGFGDTIELSRIRSQGMGKAVLDAALALAGDDLPAYTGVEGIRDYTVLRVEKATPGTTGSELLAGLRTELQDTWSNAEEQAVLKAMRSRAGVERLPEADEVIARSDSADPS